MSSTRVFSMPTRPAQGTVVRTRRAVARLATVAVAGTALGLAAGLPASATNQGTVSGNDTAGCAVAWNAHTIMDVDGVPGYDKDLSGNDAHYSNGGYVSEVSSAFGDPGFMEIQHWMGNPNDPNSIHWRVPVATTHDIKDAKLVITLPADHGYTVPAEDIATWINKWETSHTYTQVPTDAIRIAGDTVTVDLGDLKAGTGVIMQLRGEVQPDQVKNTFEAKARLTGTYVEGGGCAAPTPEAPKPETPKPTTPVTPKPTTPKPAPKPAVKYVTRTFQVDRYMPRTAAQARTVARLDDDGRLRYREDRPLWGASRWQFVTVKVPTTATKAQVVAAINKATAAKIGDVRTASEVSSAKARGTYVIAWELGKGATTKAAWGANTKVPQTFFARS